MRSHQILNFGMSVSSGLGRLPAMGWNSWNEYGCDINETVFLDTARRIVDLGLWEVGYEYVIIDDCWTNKTAGRSSETGELVPDSARFPSGIGALADAVHELGLKLGIYSDAGSLTCAGYEGSLGHEDVDAATFARWGIDYLKYDNCNVPPEWADEYGYDPTADFPAGRGNGSAPPAGYDWSQSKTAQRYDRMGTALRAVGGGPIQYSVCAWGYAHVEEWAATLPAGGHSWRMWKDITSSWGGITPIINHGAFFGNWTGFGAHSDWDMLEVGSGSLTLAESRSHFALWAALKSPLIAGTRLDPAVLTADVLAVLSNRELVAFNQDPVVGRAAAPYRWGVNPDGSWNQTHPAEYWAGQSQLGTHVFVLNSLASAAAKHVDFGEVPGLGGGGSDAYCVHDMWTGSDSSAGPDGIMVVLEAHDTAALRITVGACV